MVTLNSNLFDPRVSIEVTKSDKMDPALGLPHFEGTLIMQSLFKNKINNVHIYIF